MSNPGVITLTEKELSPSKSFRVEDNLGEAIHFHYNDIRIDLTIRELLYLARICDDTIYDLVKAEDFCLDDFDQNFLNEISQYLINLVAVKKDTVSVGSLYFLSKNKFCLPVRKKLNGTTAKRLVELERKNTEKEVHKAVLFNDNPTVMFGITQAAQAYLNDAEGSIEVIRMYFENNRYSVNARPWIPFLFRWNKKRLIKVAKVMAMRVLK